MLPGSHHRQLNFLGIISLVSQPLLFSAPGENYSLNPSLILIQVFTLQLLLILIQVFTLLLLLILIQLFTLLLLLILIQEFTLLLLLIPDPGIDPSTLIPRDNDLILSQGVDLSVILDIDPDL